MRSLRVCGDGRAALGRVALELLLCLPLAYSCPPPSWPLLPLPRLRVALTRLMLPRLPLRRFLLLRPRRQLGLARLATRPRKLLPPCLRCRTAITTRWELLMRLSLCMTTRISSDRIAVHGTA